MQKINKINNIFYIRKKSNLMLNMVFDGDCNDGV